MQNQISTRSQQNQKKNGCLILILVVLLLVLLIVIGAGAYILFSSPAHNPPLVSIISPENNSTARVGQPVVLSSLAEDSSGVSRLEIYADGALIWVQPASMIPAEKQLAAAFPWIPGSAGRHLLTARAYPVNGNPVDSSILFVDVSPQSAEGVPVEHIAGTVSTSLPSLAGIAASSGVPLADLLAVNPELAGYPPDVPLPPGTVVHFPTPAPVTPPGLVTPLPGGGTTIVTPVPAVVTPVPVVPPPGSGSPPMPIPGAPASPAWLTLDPSTCTSIHLVWTDGTEETSYKLYRRAPGEAGLTLLTSLPANTTRYNDPVSSAGSYYYLVAAINGTIEGRSSIQLVEVPGSCTPPPIPAGFSPVDLSLNILTLQTTRFFDGIYCYYSVDGGPINRLPVREPDNIAPNADGLSYPVRSGLPNHGQFILGGHPGNAPVTLLLKCRGYTGPFSIDLGAVNLSEPYTSWDGRTLNASSSTSPGFSMSYCISPGTAGCGGTLLGLLLPPAEVLFHLPAPNNLRIANTLDACDEYASFDIPGHFGDYLSCMLSGVFGVGQNTLYWDWSPGASIYTEAGLSGYQVTARITDLTSGVSLPYFQRDVHPSSRKFTLANISPACGKHITYSVQAVMAGRLSEPSELLAYDTPGCPSAVRIHISFDNLVLGPVDDEGDSWIIPPARDTDLEVTIHLLANGGPSTGWLEKGSLPTSQTMREGAYNLANMSFMNFPPLPRFSGRNNNFLDVIVTDPHEDVEFMFSAMETDDHWFGAADNTYDDMCTMRHTLLGTSLENWLLYSEEIHLDGAGTSETYCQVTAHVSVTRER